MAPRPEDEQPELPQRPASEGIFHHIHRITDLEGRMTAMEGAATMAPSDSYSRAESDAKMEAMQARMEQFSERMGSTIAKQVQDMETRMEKRLDNLVEKHIAPIKLNHHGFSRDLNWIAVLVTGIFVGMLILVIQVLTKAS